MSSSFLNKYESIVVGTGNILENEEFKKAKNPTQEVSEQYLRLVIIVRGVNFFHFIRDKNHDKGKKNDG